MPAADNPSRATPEAPLAFAGHDHAQCRDAALSAALAVCEARGLRLTPHRARALDILLESHRALGAYELLERFRAEGLSAQPPVAYRALDFLVANGLAHRIEKLNAYVACARPGAGHAPAFMICRACRRVAEAAEPAGEGPLDAAADRLGFSVERTVVEAEGLCPACRAAAGGAPA
jgi:Fur family zinc uptake transcriptional regulator